MLHQPEEPVQNIHFSMPKPPEWDNLVDRAADSIIPGTPYAEQVDAPLAIWEGARTLDAETYEENRYYGLGLVACTFMRSVGGGNTESFVSQAVNQLVDGHKRYCDAYPARLDNQGLYITEIHGARISNVPRLRTEYSKMGMAERLVASTLEASDARMVFARQLSDFTIQKIQQDAALHTLSAASFAGATAIFRTSLQKMYEQKTGTLWPRGKSFNMPVAAIASEEELRTLKLTKVGAIAATLRIDEFAGANELITIDQSNQPHLDRSKIPKEPKPVKTTPSNIPDVAHARRIGCPALYVAGAIPLVTRELPTIVANAQRRLLDMAANRT